MGNTFLREIAKKIDVAMPTIDELKIAQSLKFEDTDKLIKDLFQESTSIMMKEMKELHKSVSSCKDTNDALKLSDKKITYILGKVEKIQNDVQQQQKKLNEQNNSKS